MTGLRVDGLSLLERAWEDAFDLGRMNPEAQMMDVARWFEEWRQENAPAVRVHAVRHPGWDLVVAPVFTARRPAGAVSAPGDEGGQAGPETISREESAQAAGRPQAIRREAAPEGNSERSALEGLVVTVDGWPAWIAVAEDLIHSSPLIVPEGMPLRSIRITVANGWAVYQLVSLDLHSSEYLFMRGPCEWHRPEGDE